MPLTSVGSPSTLCGAFPMPARPLLERCLAGILAGVIAFFFMVPPGVLRVVDLHRCFVRA
jgi:hypothetical protein